VQLQIALHWRSTFACLLTFSSEMTTTALHVVGRVTCYYWLFVYLVLMSWSLLLYPRMSLLLSLKADKDTLTRIPFEKEESERETHTWLLWRKSSTRDTGFSCQKKSYKERYWILKSYWTSGIILPLILSDTENTKGFTIDWQLIHNERRKLQRLCRKTCSKIEIQYKDKDFLMLVFFLFLLLIQEEEYRLFRKHDMQGRKTVRSMNGCLETDKEFAEKRRGRSWTSSNVDAASQKKKGNMICSLYTLFGNNLYRCHATWHEQK
jgi:hypothetical protein